MRIDWERVEIDPAPALDAGDRAILEGIRDRRPDRRPACGPDLVRLQRAGLIATRYRGVEGIEIVVTGPGLAALERAPEDGR